MALPGFKVLDADAYAAMRASTVFKIKVFDLRGITVYSSEQRQIGEDALGNAGWRAAAGGRHASELTHRDRFSAFEGVVENRDLISTYVPVRAPGGGPVVGVFEIYSDVTPFLGQINAASRRFAEITAGNQARVARTAESNQLKVGTSSDQFLLIVGALLALLYGATLLIVRSGQKIIDRQSRAQEQAAQREQAWHREKMAALAAMADNVAHEVGNPLAVIAALVEDLAAREPQDPLVAGHAQTMLAQTARIATMMRQIAAFAGTPDGEPQPVDVNAAVKAVCDFLAFERAFRAAPIEFRPADRLPPCRLVPDHLNELTMNLLHAWAAAWPDGGRIVVSTSRRGGDVVISIGGATGEAGGATQVAAALKDPRTEIARRRIAAVDGWLQAEGAALLVALPAAVA
jgi:signal transduction histidine kinase